jgi:hypothetical protein
VSGPDGRTRGPRFSGGYQFPRTHATGALERGEAILSERLAGPWRTLAELRPMTGGRPDVFEVSMTWAHIITGAGGSAQLLVLGEEDARESFRRLMAELERAGGEPPDVIPAAPNAKLL